MGIMLNVSSNKDNEKCGFETKSKSIKFITSLFRRKKSHSDEHCDKMSSSTPHLQVLNVTRVPSTLSVREVNLVAPCPPSPALSTPARTRDIDSDMEALRISRHDNPFLKQVLASRESLAESIEESESDDTNLMSQEFLNDLDTDPLSLPEVHEHMIRSPPPTTWPRSPNFKMFRFPNENDNTSSQESLGQKSPMSWSASTSLKQSDDGNSKSALSLLSPRLTLPMRPHQRSSSDIRDRNFTLLNPAPLRSLTDVRRLNTRSEEDSQYLVNADNARN